MTIADEFHFLFADEFRFLFVNMCWVSYLSSMISKSHFFFFFFSLFSPYLCSKLIDIWFLIFLCLISLSFSISSFFLCLIFPLFLFFSFKPITRWIQPAKPKNRDKRFWPTVRSTTGERSVHITWAGRVTIWPQTWPVDSLKFGDKY